MSTTEVGAHLPALRNVLERFRPAGIPGAAARHGVPADRVADLTTELTPVLAALHDTEQQVAELSRQTAGEVESIRVQSREEAAAIEARAAAQVRAVRESAAARAHVRAAEEAERIAVASDRETDRIARLAAERTPAIVEEAVGWLRSDLGVPTRIGGP